jgi:hypothetical protein
MRLELPSGGWVDVRDLSSLRARDQKRLMRSMNFDDQEDKVASGLDMTDALIALLVTDWEIPYARDIDPDRARDGRALAAVAALGAGRMDLLPESGAEPAAVDLSKFVLPSEDISVIDDLQVPDYGVLNRIAQDAMKVMFPKRPDPSDYEDPTSPTAPASA